MSNYKRTEEGDLDVRHDIVVGGTFKARGSVVINKDLRIGGAICSQFVNSANMGLFETETALKQVYPSPKIGQYAYVGSKFPALLYVCKVAGEWTKTTYNISNEVTAGNLQMVFNEYVDPKIAEVENAHANALKENFEKNIVYADDKAKGVKQYVDNMVRTLEQKICSHQHHAMYDHCITEKPKKACGIGLCLYKKQYGSVLCKVIAFGEPTGDVCVRVKYKDHDGAIQLANIPLYFDGSLSSIPVCDINSINDLPEIVNIYSSDDRSDYYVVEYEYGIISDEAKKLCTYIEKDDGNKQVIPSYLPFVGVNAPSDPVDPDTPGGDEPDEPDEPGGDDEEETIPAIYGTINFEEMPENVANAIKAEVEEDDTAFTKVNSVAVHNAVTHANVYETTMSGSENACAFFLLPNIAAYTGKQMKHCAGTFGDETLTNAGGSAHVDGDVVTIGGKEYKCYAFVENAGMFDIDFNFGLI